MTQCHSQQLRFLKPLFACLLLMALVAPLSSMADQTDPALNPLFEQLQQASSNTQAKEIESQIWELWLATNDDNAEALMSQLTYAMSVGQYEIALQLSNQLVDSNPDYSEAWNKRATIQYLMGNHGLSVADIKQTLVLEPRHFGALSGLGLIFMASGNYEAALDAFNAVVKISPSSDNARGSAARAKALIGNDI